MRAVGLTLLGLLSLASSALAAKHATSSGQVAHTRRAPVAMHRMFPPFAGNHVYEKPQPDPRSEPRQARERSDREAGRRPR
jgi:hypothetical protein